MNSFKSACSVAKSTPVPFHQLEEDIESFLRRQVRVELVISTIGFLKSAEDLNDRFHSRALYHVSTPVVVMAVIGPTTYSHRMLTSDGFTTNVRFS